MAYCPDLTPCTEVPRTLAVGWLATGQPFTSGSFPDDAFACLVDLFRSPDLVAFGVHYCELCSPTANDDLDGAGLSGIVPDGSTVILVEGADGTVYAAPELIQHYVRDHGYAPPQEFTAALRRACARGRRLAEMMGRAWPDDVVRSILRPHASA